MESSILLIMEKSTGNEETGNVYITQEDMLEIGRLTEIMIKQRKHTVVIN